MVKAICPRNAVWIRYAQLDIPLGFEGSPRDGRLIENDLEAREEVDFISMPFRSALRTGVSTTTCSD